MHPSDCIGWDIGGAHLKAAYLNRDGSVEHVLQLPCPLWQGLSHLRDALEHALEELPDRGAWHAITMTGELVDLFASRADGVRQLLATVGSRLPAGRIGVYAGGAGFVSPADCDGLVEQIASANWMATAAFIAELVPQALIVDIGSTTTDIIPIRGGIQARGRNDHERLACQELVYTGIVRTPVMAVADRLPFEGEWVEPMAEHFAVMADVYRLCQRLPADADQMPAADNGGKSVLDSTRRFARMLGRDMESASPGAWRRCAEYVAELQLRRIADASARVLSRETLDENAPLIGAGVGRFLVAELAERLERPYVDFSHYIDSPPATRHWLASCAPAVAVAGLARTRQQSRRAADSAVQSDSGAVCRIRDGSISCGS
jgi:(4-(4-[2-(gamma-L-glutamylamino)ethyl]phenoxymethyl)furan-2-yl)methanamine synthase